MGAHQADRLPLGRAPPLAPRHEHQVRLDAADAEAYDKVVYDAIDFVMEASGEYTGYMLGEAQDPAVPQRFWARAQLDGPPLDADPANYVDRFGSWHLSFRSMEAASLRSRRTRGILSLKRCPSTRVRMS